MSLKAHEPYVNGIQGIFVPQTGITDYTEVSIKYAEKIKHLNGDIFLGNKVTKLQKSGQFVEVVTDKQTLTARLVINCSGLYSDKVAKLTGIRPDYRIIPFRGEIL